MKNIARITARFNYVIPMSARLISVQPGGKFNIPIFVVTPTVPTNSSMNLITIKNRYLRVQHRVGPSDSESTDFSVLDTVGRTRSNLIHRFGETHGQQPSPVGHNSESARISSHLSCVSGGAEFCTRPSRPFVGLKPRSLAERKAGVITGRCGEVLAISHGKSSAPRVRRPRRAEISVDFLARAQS